MRGIHRDSKVSRRYTDIDRHEYKNHGNVKSLTEEMREKEEKCVLLFGSRAIGMSFRRRRRYNIWRKKPRRKHWYEVPKSACCSTLHLPTVNLYHKSATPRKIAASMPL
jgi:hypothetical protein